MTDLQLVTIVVSLVIPLSMLLYGNSRITDTKETLRAEIQALRAEMKADRAEIGERFTRLETKMDVQHDVIMRLLADIDQRITFLERR